MTLLKITVEDPIELKASQNGTILSNKSVFSDDVFSTDNKLIKSDGTSRYIQSTGVELDDSDNITGLNSAEIGDKSGGDYLKVSSDGTVRIYGDGTAWRDMISDLFGKRLSSTAGKVDYDYDENAIVFSPGGIITSSSCREYCIHIKIQSSKEWRGEGSRMDNNNSQCRNFR